MSVVYRTISFWTFAHHSWICCRPNTRLPLDGNVAPPKRESSVTFPPQTGNHWSQNMCRHVLCYTWLKEGSHDLRLTRWNFWEGWRRLTSKDFFTYLTEDHSSQNKVHWISDTQSSVYYLKITRFLLIVFSQHFICLTGIQGATWKVMWVIFRITVSKSFIEPQICYRQFFIYCLWLNCWHF